MAGPSHDVAILHVAKSDLVYLSANQRCGYLVPTRCGHVPPLQIKRRILLLVHLFKRSVTSARNSSQDKQFPLVQYIFGLSHSHTITLFAFTTG